MSLAAALGLSTHVRFTGWTSTLGSVYATIDVCALSSINEGTPVALIEAMAAGRPAVAPSVGGISDVLVDGVTGKLVTAYGPDALAESLGALVGSPAERARLGQAARSHVGSRYAPARLVRDIDELYRRALEEKRARGQRVKPRSQR